MVFSRPDKKGINYRKSPAASAPISRINNFSHQCNPSVRRAVFSRSGMDIIFWSLELGLVWQWFQNPQFRSEVLGLVQ